MKIHGQFLHGNRGVLRNTWIKNSKLKPVVLDFPNGYPFDMSFRKDPTHIRVHGRKNKSFSSSRG